MKISGCRAVVTGAASGIGRALVQALVAKEATVLAADLHPERIDKSDRVTPLGCDVSRPEQLDALLDAAERALGGIDLFFSNAGFSYYEQLETPDWRHVAQIFETNLFPSVYVAEWMARRCQGRPYRVVVTCSAMAHIPMPGYALYSGTKAGLLAFAEAYRFELEDPRSFVLVLPISTMTAFFEHPAGDAPVPWPAQTAEQVAAATLAGLERDKRLIYPSRLFVLLQWLSRPFPWAARLYQGLYARTFRLWLQAHKGR
jgi:uncharacterized protein